MYGEYVLSIAFFYGEFILVFYFPCACVFCIGTGERS